MPKEGMGVLRESSAVNWLAGRSEEWPVSLCLWVSSHTADLFWHSDCSPKVVAPVCLWLSTYSCLSFEAPEKKWPQSSVSTDWQWEDMVDALRPARKLREDSTLSRARFANLRSEHATSYQSHTQALCLGFTLTTPQEARGLLQQCGSSWPSNKPGNWVIGQHKYKIGHTSHWLKTP